MTGWDMAFRRKIIAASFSAAMFAVLLGLIVPNPFGEPIRSVLDYLRLFSLSTPVYLMYSFPVILIYGVPASLAADHVAGKLARRIGRTNAEPWLSGLLHAVFGLPLLWYGAAAGLLGFAVDRLLGRRKAVFSWHEPLSALLVPLIVWVLFMGAIYLQELPGQLPDLLQTVILRY
ncbi:hypothetical protein ACFFIY_02300 [Bhargavaea ullalensis]|uniref:Tripartite tricarboxylate transporter TctB family protein n=1 Tax=Bhargavaea ullalensis TaxID=1265685 RepID=A0ABV2GB75_9BACL